MASPILAAAGSSTARRPSMFACTHCPRRTASTFGMSEGASRPVNPATWSSATRTASSNPRRSSSLGAGSSAPNDAEAMPTCLASSQFTGPLDDIRTRWISRNSGTSFQTSPGGTPNGFSSGVWLIRPSYGRARLTPSPDRPRDASKVGLLATMSSMREDLLVRVTPDPIGADEAVDFVSDPAAGGTCVFLGTVRDHSDGGGGDGAHVRGVGGAGEAPARGARRRDVRALAAPQGRVPAPVGRARRRERSPSSSRARRHIEPRPSRRAATGSNSSSRTSRSGRRSTSRQERRAG